MEEHCRECGLNVYNADEEGLYHFFDNTDPLCVDCACDLSNSYHEMLKDATNYLKDTLEFGVDKATLKGKINVLNKFL
jgi:hypothetical protein